MNNSMFEKAWNDVRLLVERFRQNEHHFLSVDYQEAHVRQDFLNKLFKALGWDVDHEQQVDPWRQEVRIEKPEHKARGRADYSFSIAPHFKRVRFFVEAKRPLANIVTPDNCFQAIRYSWPKAVPIAVLTDFRSLVVLDSRYKPNINSATSRVVRSWHYLEYLTKDGFSEIYYLLSREAVTSGSIENFASNRLPTPELAARQYTLFAGEARAFDDEFLQTLDDWRNSLAGSFKAAQSTLNGDQLTECVQRTLDRLLFTRFLEDKQIEQDALVANFGSRGHSHWRDFVATCARLDTTYNGVVFKKHDILDDPTFDPTGAVFASICDDLSDQHTPYNFDSIPVEILGRIYERFLGKVVRIKGQSVSVEDKPEVRKAGGVYYTPDYVVAYMVDNALSPLLAGKTPLQFNRNRIIDSACGSGSFLIGVYSFLLQATLRYWAGHQDAARKYMLDIRDGEVRLTLRYRREILVNCIFGIDIDPQAAEVAQLSLYLKLLEDETTHSAFTQQVEIGAALLPSLAENIIVANSLLATTHDSDLFADDSGDVWNIRRAFPAAFDAGGFDLVIGNPPYIKEYTNRDAFNGVRESPYYEGKMDIWYMFACLALDWLKPATGTLAYIATNNWVTNAGAKKLRTKITNEARISQFVDFGDLKVFRDAGIQTMILIARKDNTEDRYTFDFRRITAAKPITRHAQDLMEKVSFEGGQYSQVTFDRSREASAALTFATGSVEALLQKIRHARNFSLNGDNELAQGIVAPQDFLNKKSQRKLGPRFRIGQGVFVLSAAERKSLKITKEETKLLKPYYTTEQLGRYFGDNKASYSIIYTDSSFAKPDAMTSYPNIRRHLDAFAKIITSHYGPYGLHRARDERFFIGRKIVALRKCEKPTFTLTDFPCYVSQTFNVIKTDRVDLGYLCALLNSRLIRFWLKHNGKMQGQNFQVDKEPLLAIPIRVPDLQSQRAVRELVAKALDVQRKLRAADLTQARRTRLEQIANQIDDAINEQVEAIYVVDASDRAVPGFA